MTNSNDNGDINVEALLVQLTLIESLPFIFSVYFFFLKQEF
jgi:hypothetical protein